MAKNTFGSLSDLFSNKKAVIGIIGLGYVGSPGHEIFRNRLQDNRF